jgi:polysaccharide pyruvyl transferase CsaB
LQFTVSGYYGCGNAGDEAVLAGIQEGLARRGGGQVELLALSQAPEETRALHGLRAVHRMRMREVRSAIRSSDLLLSGGGSLLQDTTSARSLLYYLFIVRLALAYRVPVMFYAQGLGPLRRPLSRVLVRGVAERAAFITVRDPASERLLREIGVTNPRVEVTADPAFALSPAPEAEVDRLLQQAGIPVGEPLIGVALRPWGGAGEQSFEPYARLLTELEHACASRVVLLPMQIPGDVTFAEEVAQATGTPEHFPIVRQAAPPSVLLGLTAQLQAVVAMRLHTLIFAAHAAVPPFALAYDPKVTHLMTGLGLEDCLADWRSFDPADLAARVRTLLQDRSARAAALQARLPDLEQRALSNADRALSLFR